MCYMVSAGMQVIPAYPPTSVEPNEDRAMTSTPVTIAETTLRKPGATRRLQLAIAAAAIPAVVLSSAALAQPAAAVTAASAVTSQPNAIGVPLSFLDLNRMVPTAQVPAQRSAGLPTAKIPSSYTVKPGDTISAIAGKYGLSTATLLQLNGLQSNTVIFPGRKIRLSGASHSTPATPQKAAPKAAPATPQKASGSYTVKAGDTLGRIAAQHGVSLGSILSANRLSMSAIIHPGQRIILAGGSTAVRSTSSNQSTNLVPSTFGNYTYPTHVVSQANVNKQTLNSRPAPSREQMKAIIADTARKMGVDPRLALAFAQQESGFNHRSVSPANAIGAMQVIPSSGQWASDLVGSKLNLLDPHDNATAGIAIIRSLVRTSKSLDVAIASYYQGQYSVAQHGMYQDTKGYVRSVTANMAMFG